MTELMMIATSSLQDSSPVKYKSFALVVLAYILLAWSPLHNPLIVIHVFDSFTYCVEIIYIQGLEGYPVSHQSWQSLTLTLSSNFHSLLVVLLTGQCGRLGNELFFIFTCSDFYIRDPVIFFYIDTGICKFNYRM